MSDVIARDVSDCGRSGESVRAEGNCSYHHGGSWIMDIRLMDWFLKSEMKDVQDMSAD